MDLFEYASRNKLRFPSLKGQLAVEQLWDLPLTAGNGFSLDAVARQVNNDLKEVNEESFVTTSNPERPALEAKLDIVKHIIAWKQEQNALKRDAATKAEQREKLRQILRDKKDKSLENLSEAELEARLTELGG